jgi:hypothetical protein
VKITGYVQSDGRLTGVRIETADGLRASEASVAEALRKVRLDDVPTGLVGAKLTFYVGHAG